jgi:hypothetical protein
MRALLFMLLAAVACFALAHITPTDQPQLRFLRWVLRIVGAFFALLLLVAVVQAFFGYI